MMGPDVVFVSQNHNFTDPDIPLQDQGEVESDPVEVGDNIWIGTSVIILPGRKIGNNVIIGAGAVVTKDVPRLSIVGGVPAEVLRFREELKDG